MSVIEQDRQAVLADLDHSTWPESTTVMEQCIVELGRSMVSGVIRDAPDVDEYKGYPEAQRSVALEELCEKDGHELPSWFHDGVTEYINEEVTTRRAAPRTGIAQTFGFNKADYPYPPALKIHLEYCQDATL
jgi:hypothetical protein